MAVVSNTKFASISQIGDRFAQRCIDAAIEYTKFAEYQMQFVKECGGDSDGMETIADTLRLYLERTTTEMSTSMATIHQQLANLAQMATTTDPICQISGTTKPATATPAVAQQKKVPMTIKQEMTEVMTTAQNITKKASVESSVAYEQRRDVALMSLAKLISSTTAKRVAAPKAKPTKATTGKRESSLKRSWSCRYCGKQFLIRSGLASHERVHTGEKPYSCDKCRKRFSQLGNMKQHSNRCNKNNSNKKMETSTSSSSSVYCRQCGLVFSNVADRDAHETINLC